MKRQGKATGYSRSSCLSDGVAPKGPWEPALIYAVFGKNVDRSSRFSRSSSRIGDWVKKKDGSWGSGNLGERGLGKTKVCRWREKHPFYKGCKPAVSIEKFDDTFLTQALTTKSSVSPKILPTDFPIFSQKCGERIIFQVDEKRSRTVTFSPNLPTWPLLIMAVSSLKGRTHH